MSGRSEKNFRADLLRLTDGDADELHKTQAIPLTKLEERRRVVPTDMVRDVDKGLGAL
jgi:hypothetical protein